MSWRELLSRGPEARVLAWLGGRDLSDGVRRWTVEGPLPDEHGWYTFAADTARRAKLVGPGEPDPAWEAGRPVRRGWLVGDRLVPDDAAVVPDPDRFVAQTVPVALVPPALGRFARARAVDLGRAWVFAGEEFPTGPEEAVVTAFTEGPPDLSGIPGVPPALELAFRFAVDQREHGRRRREDARLRRLAEEAAAAAEAEAAAALALAQAEAARATALRAAERRVGAHRGADDRTRRALVDALGVSGATLLDHRPSWERGEVVVTFRFRHRRFECVVDRALRIVDAGICLNDYDTGTKGDTLFTLESLPAVIDEAMRTGRLVVFRHAEGG